MTAFANRHCTPVTAATPLMTAEQVRAHLPSVPEWAAMLIERSGTQIQTLQRTMTFRDFRAAMAFLRQVEDLAEVEQHHPNFTVQYNKVSFEIYTHVIGGLHENDFILAAKISDLVQANKG